MLPGPPVSEDFPKVEIEAVMAVLGKAIGDIERTDKGVKPDKQAAGTHVFIVEILHLQNAIPCASL